MSTVLEFAAHPPAWVAYVALGLALVLAAVAGWFAKPDRPARDVGLDILEPEEQVGDDTLAMVAEDRSAADMWDSFEEADVHGIEVDDTAAEGDMVPRANYTHNPGFVIGSWDSLLTIAYEDHIVADIEAWLFPLDAKAWLGERGWL